MESSISQPIKVNSKASIEWSRSLGFVTEIRARRSSQDSENLVSGLQDEFCNQRGEEYIQDRTLIGDFVVPYTASCVAGPVFRPSGTTRSTCYTNIALLLSFRSLRWCWDWVLLIIEDIQIHETKNVFDKVSQHHSGLLKVSLDKLLCLEYSDPVHICNGNNHVAEHFVFSAASSLVRSGPR